MYLRQSAGMFHNIGDKTYRVPMRGKGKIN